MRSARRWFRRWLLTTAILTPLALTGAESLVFDQPQLAGISGFRAFRDLSVVLADDGPRPVAQPLTITASSL